MGSRRLLKHMLERAGAYVPVSEFGRRTPEELSLAEKWAIEQVQPGFYPQARVPFWLRKFIFKVGVK